MANARAVRIKRADGTWQDIALQGPPGIGVPTGGGTGQVLAKKTATDLDTNWINPPAGGSGGGGGHTIQDEGTSRAQRTKLNFTGAGVTVTDDAENDRTLVDVPAITVAAARGSSATYTDIAGAWKALPVVLTTIEPSDAFTVSAGVVTVKDAGWYDVAASIASNQSASNSLYLSISTSASPGDGDIANQGASGATYARISASGSIKLAAGAKVYIYGWSPSAGPVNVNVYAFSIARVGGPKGEKGEAGVESSARIWRSGTTQNVPTAVWTNIVYNSITDVKGAGAPTLNTDGFMQINEAGIYVVTFTGYFQDNAGGRRLAQVIRNRGGTLVNYARESFTTSVLDNPGVTLTCQIPCLVGDVISASVYQDSGAGIWWNVESGNQSSLMATKLGGSKGDKGDKGDISSVTMDPWHIVGAAGEPAFGPGVSNYDTTRVARFRKDPLGVVRLAGVIKGAGQGAVIFTLPPGYWPPRGQIARVSTGNSGLLDIQIGATGAVTVTIGSATSYGYLEDIAFDTETVTAMPTGPQGPKGDTGGNATVPMDTWHNVGAAGEPAFTGSPAWTNYGGAYVGARFRKFPDGRVKLGGVIKNGAGVVFVLPDGYRPGIPGADQSFVVPISGGYGIVNVASNGGVTVAGTGSATYTYLDGVEFDSGTVTAMPTGPQGPKGDTGGNASISMDPWHVVGTAGEPAFVNGWTRLEQGFMYPAFRKDPLGKVQLRGSVVGGSSNVVFTLPVGYRPLGIYRMTGLGGQTAATWIQINVQPNGNVEVFADTFNQYVSLDQIEFDTDTVTAMPTGPQGPKGDPGNVRSLLTTLPADAVDNEEIVLLIDERAWSLKYKLSQDRWYFTGGAPLYRSSIGPATVNMNYGGGMWSYDFADYAGPQFVVPYAGLWDINFTADVYVSVAQEIRMTLSDAAFGAQGQAGGIFGHQSRSGSGSSHTANHVGRGVANLVTARPVYLAVMWGTNLNSNVAFFQINAQFEIKPVYLNGV